MRDLGSTNGTHVDGERMDHGALAVGKVVRLGDWLAVVEERDIEDATSAFAELAPGIWGGALLARVLRPLVSVAPTQVPVLLVGRTGTGKERFARALHQLGGDQRPFHAINCAALPAALAEAELFGYRKGAFTGAERSYAGQLRAAQGGTLFLDEVADLSPAIQAKLLRALDSGEIAPIGENARARFEARVVAACQQPLSELVAAGRFREDLAARLDGLTIALPELQQRRADIPALFDMFLRKYSGGTAPAVSTRLYERLCLHTWPGNVRELELLARRLLAVHGLEPVLRRSHLPDALRDAGAARDAEAEEEGDRNSRDVNSLAAALKQARGNVRVAAKIAGISRQRAYRLIGSRRLGQLISASRDGTPERENGPGE